MGPKKTTGLERLNSFRRVAKKNDSSVLFFGCSIVSYVARSYPLAIVMRAYAWTTGKHLKKTVGLCMCARIGQNRRILMYAWLSAARAVVRD